VDGVSAGSATGSYQPTLTSAGLDKATASIKTAFANCARQTGLRPDGCPQAAQSIVNSGQWQLIGDPTQGVAFAVDSSANLVGGGHFQMIFNYQESGLDGTAHKASAGGYQAILKLVSNDVAVTSIKSVTELPALAA